MREEEDQRRLEEQELEDERRVWRTARSADEAIDLTGHTTPPPGTFAIDPEDVAFEDRVSSDTGVDEEYEAAVADLQPEFHEPGERDEGYDVINDDR